MTTNVNPAGELVIESALLKKGASVYRALNHPLRQKILQLIHKDGKIKVTDLYIKLRLEQSLVSQHLAILRHANIVLTQREGKFIYYSVNYQKLAQIHKLAQELINMNPTGHVVNGQVVA